MSSIVYKNVVVQSSELVKKLSKLAPNDEFYSIISSLKTSILSTSDAFTLFNICYKYNYKDRQLFINYINPIENAFFGCLEKIGDSKDYRSLVINLPVKAKVKIILGDKDDLSNYKIMGRKSKIKDKIMLDYERYEKASLKKLKRVVTAKFPAPIIRQPIPGIRLANSLASSIRESINTMSINDLAYTCKIFSIKHPLSGSLIEDTMELLVDNISRFNISTISGIIIDIVKLYQYVQERFIELKLDGLEYVDYSPIIYPKYITKLRRIIDECTRAIESESVEMGEDDSRIIATSLLSSGLRNFNIITINYWLKKSNVQINITPDSRHQSEDKN